MRRVRLAVLLVAVLALAGCAHPPAGQPASQNPRLDTRVVGPLRVKLARAERSKGVLTVVLVTTNSSETTQPAWFEHTAPWVVSDSGLQVRRRDVRGDGITARGVVGGGPLSSEPQSIGPTGTIVVTSSFDDPGGVVRVYFDPVLGVRRNADATTTVSWVVSQ